MIWVAVAAVIIGAGVLMYMRAGYKLPYKTSGTEESARPASSENQAAVAGTAELEQELQGIKVEGLDAELEAMGKEVVR